jgi:hypothetical protein
MANRFTAIARLDRAATITRDSMRFAHAAARLAQARLREGHLHPASALSSDRAGGIGGESRSFKGALNLKNERSWRNRFDPAQFFSRAMKAIPNPASRESAKAVHTIETARRIAPEVIERTGLSNRVRDGVAVKGPSHSHAALQANLRVASSAIATRLVNPSPHELIMPSTNDRRGSDSGGSLSAITINSSPTVVINATAAESNIRRDVIEALRTHREELFDQMKRVSARRERAQF